MQTGTPRTAVEFAGVIGLTLLGLAALGGCNPGGHDAPSRPEHSTGDAHGGHDHESRPGGAASAPVVGELKPISPSGSYPLATCVVSGEALTGMDGPIAFEYEGTEVQFCCKGCIQDFRKDPAAYMQKVRAARK